MTGFDQIQDLRNEAESFRRKAKMREEIAELTEYLNELDNVTYNDVSDGGASIFVTVHCKELKGTVKDMVSDFSIFGHGIGDDGEIRYTFEVKEEHFK